MKRTALAALVCSAFLACNSAAGAVSTENWESSLKNAPTSLAASIGEELLLDDADDADKTASPETPSKSAEHKESAQKDVSHQKPAKSDKARPSSNIKEKTTADKADAGEANKDDAKDGKKAGYHNAAPASVHALTSDDQRVFDSLDTLKIAPLEAGDFYIGSIHSGDSPMKVKRIFGNPSKYSTSMHYTSMQYTGKDLKLRFVIRNKLADSLRSSGDSRKSVRPGVESAFLTTGTNILIGRDMRLKYPIEVLLRQFGLPDSVLRDTDANVYYVTYESPKKDAMYVFAVGNRRVERVALMPVRPPYITGEPSKDPMKLTEKDFTLMGFGLNQPFEANKYNMWNKLVKRNNSSFWLYGDYGVEVDRRNMVQKVFLLTNNGYTSRGATLGYHVSTILALYGRPDRVEWGPDKEKSVDAYYYDSPYQKGVSLVIIMRHNEPYVDDVILTSTPIKNIQDPMERYGLK